MVGVPQDGEKTVLQKTQEHNQALFRMQQIQKENAAVRQQREKAPGSIKEGTVEAQQVKKEESQDAQQAYFGGGFQQKGSSADSFIAQREAALKSGKFDYSAVRSSFYSPPGTFVNTKGERVSRTAYTPPVSISFGGEVSGTSSPKASMPVLKISQSELQKSNALRASQGLPPLEQVTTVQIVTPTKGPSAQLVSRLSARGKPPINLGEKLAQAQGSFQSGGGGEAVSFLRFPFTSNKGPSSGGIQSTTILDPLQFLGIEAGASIIAKGASFVGSLIKSEGRTIIREGAKDIGLNIKPSEAYLKAKSFEAQAARLPPPATIKPTVTPNTPTVPTFASTEVSLGKGLGISTGEKGGTTATDLFKPSPPGKPSEVERYQKSREQYMNDRLASKGLKLEKTSTGYKTVPINPKETTVGKGGLTQIVREKSPAQKTVTLKEKPKFEQRQLQKQDQLLKQRLKPKTTATQKSQAQIKTDNYLKSLQKTRLMYKPKQDQEHAQSFYPIPLKTKQRLIPPSSKQKQKYIPGPVFIPTPPPPKPKQTTVPTLIPITIPKPKSKYIPGPVFIPTPPPKIPTGLSKPPPKIPPPETLPSDKKRPPFDPLLSGARSGGLGKVSKSGARKGYIGNVPIESLVGVYKRSEVTYTNKSASQINKKQKTTTNRNFKLLGSKSIKI